MAKFIDEVLGSPESHPSFGQVSIHRTTSNQANVLYGCGVRHYSSITIRVSRSERRHRHHCDSYYAKERLIEFEMSPDQFANLITSMNLGDGVPCTLRWLPGTGMCPPIELINKREQLTNEFDAHISAISDELQALCKEAEDIAARPSVGKGERSAFAERLNRVLRKLAMDTPFIAKQFDEAMDGIVQETKAEAEAYASNLIRETGLAAMISHENAAENMLRSLEMGEKPQETDSVIESRPFVDLYEGVIDRFIVAVNGNSIEGLPLIAGGLYELTSEEFREICNQIYRSNDKFGSPLRVAMECEYGLEPRWFRLHPSIRQWLNGKTPIITYDAIITT